MSLAFTTSCVLPIPASPAEGGDGGVEQNGNPVILEANPMMPGPLQLDPTRPQQLTVTLNDTDIEDTLYVRVYRDYQKAALGFVDERRVTNDAVLGKPTRLPLTLPTNNWCNGITTATQLIFDVMVADQPFDPDGTKKPEYRAVTNNGHYSIRSWIATCVPPV